MFILDAEFGRNIFRNVRIVIKQNKTKQNCYICVRVCEMHITNICQSLHHAVLSHIILKIRSNDRLFCHLPKFNTAYRYL